VKVREAIKMIETDGWYLAPDPRQPSSLQAPEQTRNCDHCRTPKRWHSERHAKQYLEASWIEDL